ncbi:hypothetical protein CYMTET_9156 [Cymbomonas tetramitiformis]|uniref:GPS domain-containing protein n=1 Tax=Cymbomonas tetramitiformis TaxID=36881 RepID=A0AAE0GRL6_9CHLO|nr:hypothetical protein CYMTET_9156 [Cymbomonas tetramitiformis]
MDTTVSYTEVDLAAGATPSALSDLLASDPAQLFATSSLLVGLPVASSESVVFGDVGETAPPVASLIAANPGGLAGAAVPVEDATLAAPAVCPEGSASSGEGVCVELRGCAAAPCYPGVLCTEAPPDGFSCGACPAGHYGDGEQCLEDLCATTSPCDALMTCTPDVAGAGFTCGDCPGGYYREGMTCIDVDECAAADRGGCDDRVSCTNIPGGARCGECPAGMLGSGSTRCMLSGECATDNGGCDMLTTCEDLSDGTQECGACPAGYTGTGKTGCQNEDGCAVEGRTGCYGECIDVAPPGTGHTCAPCPLGMVGDGATCDADLCFEQNGFCDPLVSCTTDFTAKVRICGECPAGYAKVLDTELVAGFRCEDVDACVEEPCWSLGQFSQPCTDVVAPGTGRVCGECPSGFETSPGGEGCTDVDECQLAANGACWVSDVDASIKSECVNTPGGHTCSACPEKYIGTGEAGCRERVLCEDNYGNCDTKAISCTDNPSTGYAECGPCPPGYDGTGATACVDTDGCLEDPCFPGVACTDISAPGEGRTCGGCPEGYRGDGATCEACTLGLHLDPLMGTVVDNRMRRSAINQLAGVYDGLSAGDCVLTQGVQYLWEAVTSDGVTVPLDSTTNMRETLTLRLPRSSLTARVSYTVRLTVSLRGAPRVATAVQTSFLVFAQPLVALIQGGLVQTGEGLPVLLDAGDSFDPDQEPGALQFSWVCRRIDAGAPERDCRDVSGTLLPFVMTDPSLALTLRGSAEGAVYAFTCEVSKAERHSKTNTTVTILTGSPPVPTITPLLHKPTPNGKLTLSSQVESLRPDSLLLRWSLQALQGHSGPLDLAGMAASALDGPFLVLRPGALVAGGLYRFTLNASDANGPASVALEVRVNDVPHSGSLSVAPQEGTMSETEFSIRGSGWEDAPEDKPLWYQVRYQVVGVDGAPRQMLSAWQPSPEFALNITAAGVEAHGHRVTIFLYVKDALEAMTYVSQDVVVKPLVFADDTAQDAFVSSAITSALQGASLGLDTSSAILTVTSILGPGTDLSPGRRLVAVADGRNFTAQAAQRAELMELVEVNWQALPPMTDVVTRISQSAAAVASDAQELTEVARSRFSAVAASLVGATRSADPDSRLDVDAAEALLNGLSSVAVGSVGASNQSAEVEATVAVARDIGFSNAQWMVPEEDPVAVGSAVLSSVVQRADLTSGSSRAYAAPLQSPSGAEVRFSASLGQSLGAAAAAATIMMTSSMVDPHSAVPKVLLDSDASPSHILSDVTDITIYGGANGSELAVSHQQEAFTFSLPMHGNGTEDDRVPLVGAVCTFWDESASTYSSEGCATLPNPTPPGVTVYWHTTNTSAMQRGLLEAAWGMEGGELAHGCDEMWDAVFPEYAGTDAGRRKYLGAECELTNPSNNVSCWWDWRAGETGAFQGQGCVWAEEAQCLCTHLTEFGAAQGTDIGSFEPPDRVSTYSTDDMSRLSFSDVGKSVVLLSVLAILLGGSTILFLSSNFYHNRERLKLLLKMVDKDGLTFEEKNGLWTWSIVDKGYKNAYERQMEGKKNGTDTLGSLFAKAANEEKKKLDQERLGIAGSAASKWKRMSSIAKNPGEAPTSQAGAGLTASQHDGTEEAEASSPKELSSLQRSVKSAWKKGIFSGFVANKRISMASISAMTSGEQPSPSASRKPPTPAMAYLPQEQEQEATGKPEVSSATSGGDDDVVRFENGKPEVSSAAWLGDDDVVAFEIGEARARLNPPQRGPDSKLGAPKVNTRRKEGKQPGTSMKTSSFDQSSPAFINAVLHQHPSPSQAQPACSSTRQVVEDERGNLKEITTTTITTTTQIVKEVSLPAGSQPGPVLEAYERIPEDEDAQRLTDVVRALHAEEELDEEDASPNASTGLLAASGRQIKKSSVFSKAFDRLSQFSKPKPVPVRRQKTTARALFSHMHINIFRLQLCIPLDYLEKMALHELSDERRRARREASSAMANTTGHKVQGTHGSSVKGTWTANLPSMSGFMGSIFGTRGAEAELAASSSKAPQEQQGSSPSTSLRSQWAVQKEEEPQKEEEQTVEEVPRWQSPLSHASHVLKTVVLKDLASGTQPGVPAPHGRPGPVAESFEGKADATDVDDGADDEFALKPVSGQFVKAGRISAVDLGLSGKTSEPSLKVSKAKGMWRKLQMRQMELPVERMLGTAIVQAFLGIHAILAEKDLQDQMALAEELPWQMPSNRPFSWYVSVFKVLVKDLGRNGWYQRSLLWNAVFLQRVDGSFELSGHLATMLKAGDPLEDLEDNPVSPHDVEVLRQSMPPVLLRVYREAGIENIAAPPETWATILVLNWLSSLPYSWTENPDDPPSKQVTLRGRSQMFLQDQCGRVPGLEPLLPDLHRIALDLTDDWKAAFDRHVEELYEQKGKLKLKSAAKDLKEMTPSEIWQRACQQCRRSWNWSKRQMRWLAKAHPLTAIYLVKATEPFSRSERILIQTNTFLLMLTFTVWFYFSKAENCCMDRRTFLGCPDALDVRAPCMGLTYCAALHDMGMDGMLPEESEFQDFVCMAFPQSTYAGRIYVILIIIGILTPVTMIVSQLFIMASNSAIPAHWGTFPVQKMQGVFGPGPTAVLQTIAFTAYALFFNFQKFNKAVAVTIVSLIGFMLKPQMVQTAIRVFLGTVYWMYTMMKRGLRTVKHAVFGAALTKAPTGELELLEQVSLVSPMEKHLQKVAYFCIAFAWIWVTYSLLIFSMRIREMMGAKAESELISSWATVLAVEMFGKEAIKLIFIRLVVNFIMETAEHIFLGLHPSVLWHEKYIMTVATANAAEADDTGDQDMGDDADADGGGDQDAGDNDIGM